MKCNPIIRQVVNRCYAGDSNRQVIKYVISRLAKGYETWKTMPKSDRKSFMRQAIAVHKANRREYYAVMSGSLTRL